MACADVLGSALLPAERLFSHAPPEPVEGDSRSLSLEHSRHELLLCWKVEQHEPHQDCQESLTGKHQEETAHETQDDPREVAREFDGQGALARESAAHGGGGKIVRRQSREHERSQSGASHEEDEGPPRNRTDNRGVLTDEPTELRKVHEKSRAQRGLLAPVFQGRNLQAAVTKHGKHR